MRPRRLAFSLRRFGDGALRAAASAVLAGLALSGCGGRQDLSERPPVSTAATPDFGTEPSHVGVAASLPLSQLKQVVNAEIPPSYAVDWTAGKEVCARRLIKACATPQYRYTLKRGEVAVQGVDGDSAMLTVTLTLDGQVGFKGEGAHLLGLDHKPVSAQAVFDVRVRPDITPDWCPRLAVAATYHWVQKPRVEVIHGVWVDVAEPAERQLDRLLPRLQSQVSKAIDCGKIQRRLQALYATRALPVTLPGAEPLFLNIAPAGIAFSGFKVDTQAIHAAARLDAKLEVLPKAVAAAPLPLPPLKREPMAQPRTTLAVPLRVPYAVLQAALTKALSGKTFEHAGPAGAMQVTVGDIGVYATNGGRLVVGLALDVKAPGRLLDTQGTVFLIGTPQVEGGTVLSVKDASYTRILDNGLWNAVSVLLDSQIRSQIQQGLRYDLSADAERARAALAQALERPGAVPGAQVGARDVSVALGRVAVGASALSAELLVGATVTVTPDVPGLLAKP